MGFKVVDYSSDPVVVTYMECVAQACANTGLGCCHVQYKSAHDKKKDIMVSDSVLTALYYLVRGYKHHVVWMQGVMPEESYMRNSSKLRMLVLSAIEKIVLKKAEYILFVSEEMKKHYTKKYGLDFSEKSYVMPCFNELSVIPETLNKKEKYKKNNFVYVGSLKAWQCFEETAKLYSMIEEAANSKTHFFVFTSDQEKARKIIQNYGIKNYSMDYVKSSELAYRLAECKYGFVIREDTTVNRVATPTKFANYLASGVIPIYSDCLVSFANVDKNVGLGLVANIDDMENAVEKTVEHMNKELLAHDVKTKCEWIFENYYNPQKNMDAITKQLRGIYSRMISK